MGAAGDPEQGMKPSFCMAHPVERKVLLLSSATPDSFFYYGKSPSRHMWTGIGCLGLAAASLALFQRAAAKYVCVHFVCSFPMSMCADCL